jgi:hypothetical protein
MFGNGTRSGGQDRFPPFIILLSGTAEDPNNRLFTGCNKAASPWLCGGPHD